MHRKKSAAGLFLVALITGILYAVVVGLFASPLRAPFIALPILTALFWLVFWKFKAVRFAGFLWALPVALIAFELFWSAANPGMVADRYTAVDRSHYKSGRVKRASAVNADAGIYGAGVSETLFGADGFRADPQTGKGNPERCQFALIGDSMVYGSGLPYQNTFGPVLAEMRVRACVLGVTGNSPIDYLATARYVADRIDPGAYVAFYLYAYNDFVNLNKYASRGILSLSKRFPRVFTSAAAFDNWRQSTFTFSRFTAKRFSRDGARCPTCAAGRERGGVWQYDFGKSRIKIFYPHDPAQYEPPKPLNRQKRAALQYFFDGVREFSRGRSWRVAMIIHPDESEFYANVARRAASFTDLDPRRAEALKICNGYGFFCTDISRHIYKRALEEGENPYFANNRHFSIAGTQIVRGEFRRSS
ncbi:MAG: phage holin family protein [Candidatus Binatia bacterium]